MAVAPLGYGSILRATRNRINEKIIAPPFEKN
jgi:hypothetical protein